MDLSYRNQFKTAGPQRTPELPFLILTQCDLNEYNTISVSGIRILRLKWCWNSDVADVCADYCEWKMVDCWMSSFFLSLGSRVKTNPHETAALVHDLLAGTLWELVCSMSLHFSPLPSMLQSWTVRRRTAVHHGKTVNVAQRSNLRDEAFKSHVINQLKEEKVTILSSLEMSCLLYHAGLHLCTEAVRKKKNKH